VIVCEPVPIAVGVYVTEQLAELPLPASVHVPVPLNVPAPFDVKVTKPVGVEVVPGLVSVTVAVHDVEPPSVTVAGEHVTVVPVERLLTVMLVEPSLPL
jgi:hypothetical protein